MPTATKQLALNLFEKTRKEFLENARWIAIRIAKENNGYVNIDQVRDQVITPNGIDPRVYGAVFNTRDFKKSSYILTTRKTSHGRPIAVFFWKGYVSYKSNKRNTNIIYNSSLFSSLEITGAR